MVYIKSLSKEIWPGYIPPYQDELFSSWFFRLAGNHKIKTYSFSKEKLGAIPIWNRDSDMYYSKKLIKKLVLHTPLNEKRIKSLFLNSYEGYLFEKVNTSGKSKGILPLGIYHRYRKRKGLLFCPRCLKERKYFKKEWRLSSSIVCLKCNSFLQDSCPKCNKPIVFHRLDIKNKSELLDNEITNCYNCLYDLSMSPVLSPNIKYIQYQKCINKTLYQGYNNISNYSFSYFFVLFRLCNLLGANSLIWNKFSSYFRDKYESFGLNEVSHREFDYCDIKARRVLLYEAYFLLKDFPVNFKKFVNENRINYTDFWRDDNNRLPFFIYDILKT
ncbi:TniQ family protein [Tenacibaculum aestuarii]|uniref:TniQ family protein n=1 Tax=Tenacibaculum aestuarii TaxID=362781 RepID=UPI003895A3A9